MRRTQALALLALLPLGGGCAGSTPLASFQVESFSGDESCSKLLDYCIRVSCNVRNAGPVPGQAVVDLLFMDANGSLQQKETQRIELGPGDSRTIRYDFKEAKLLGSHDYKIDCIVR